MTPEQIIKTLDMKPHPEGGWYAETWRGGACGGESGGADGDTGRPAGSAIYFLLEAGQHSRWHRIDAAEIWHWYAGSALSLRIHENGETRAVTLGPDLGAGQRPQQIVPPRAWQDARPLDGWVLVGCTVSPAFLFETFDLPPEGWSP